MTVSKPLVLDIDGTLLRTDMLFENVWAGLGTDPIRTIKAGVTLFRKPARLKEAVYNIADIRVDLLPVNTEALEFAKAAQADGREVILASASDERLVQALADHNGFDGAIGSKDGRNLKGANKAAALVERYGKGGFDYAGDDSSDTAIWDVADKAIIVGTAGGAAARYPSEKVTTFDAPHKTSEAIRAMRPHQWVKNVLLFLPMIAAHQFGLVSFGLIILGIMAFSAAASCIYIVNDLLDLEADRLHVKKCKRPFAAGTVPIKTGMMICAGLGVFALGLGAFLGIAFFGVVALYMILSLAYSLKLKRMRWIDIFTLASLYTIRVVAGAAASRVDASVFILIFIFPIFVTLGCVKRLTELTLATNDDRLPGRGYGRPDRPDLLNVGILGMIGALVIFFLYSFSEQARMLYPSQWLLWVALIPIAAWLNRMVRLGWYGKQDYDPIVFALKDKRGIGLLLITLSLMFYSAGLWQKWFGF
ncbi:MAG: UbiA family prenyltransferase [Marivivens sp.]|uniref:UbiA family prenyltransferase n=1 Tax=Marivivens sp. TaxID=1978374 RepID=UPI00181ACCD7|nr:UbiA family prenyltransferase [Marivivens sp.]NVJ96460.1 UbiA family prenyltransferase [Marivivens sp.]